MECDDNENLSKDNKTQETFEICNGRITGSLECHILLLVLLSNLVLIFRQLHVFLT